MPINKAKNLEEYQANYNLSISHPEIFWQKEAKRLSWFKSFTKVKSANFNLDKHHVKWFEDGTLNVSYNCLDRHLATRANKPAIIWESDSLNRSQIITYAELHQEVCKFSNALKKLGIKKGDTVIIYMPMAPQAAVSMLACARIGAIHSVVFAGFSAQSLSNRIIDCKPKAIITVDQIKRGDKTVKLKENVDEATINSPVENVIAVNFYNSKLNNALDYDQLINQESAICEPEELNAEDPLFILYTSGSTGTPKGIMHSNAGYLLYSSMTHEHIFNIEEDDVYWCSADIGWITGHSYVIYGPLCNGSTTLMFDGIPTYPEANRFWQIIEKYKVTIFYTAPTILRSLIRFGNELVQTCDLSSLKTLGSVGEPIDPKTWQWFYDIIGNKKCNIVDTWWQTETGGIMISPLINVTKNKPGSASFPFYGIIPEIKDNNALVIKEAWPGIFRNVYNDHQRMLETYFTDFPGFYCSGDGASKDSEGYYWLSGRMDDVLNVSGHRIGTAEIEGLLKKISQVAESAVVGFPHPIKGESIYAFIVLKNGISPTNELKETLISEVRKSIGAIVNIDKLQWTDQLPKTRSGKVMRRILRQIANGETKSFGDISTLTNPEIMQELISNYQHHSKN